MITWFCLFFAVVVQYASAQVIPYGMLKRSINIGNNARGVPNSMAIGRGLANGIGKTQLVAANNMSRGNIDRLNLVNADNNLANNYAFGKANANLANIVETNLANPQVLANDITAAALENFANANQIPNIHAPAVIVNMPEGATYNLGNSPIPVTVTGRSQYGSQPVGINILADNLEVQGMVTVVGRMPIFGAVKIDGNLPSDGKASVNYGCDAPAQV